MFKYKIRFAIEQKKRFFGATSMQQNIANNKTLVIEFPYIEIA